MQRRDTNTGRRTRTIATVAQAGALVAAVVASACCWLPLLLVALGLSGGTLAARFEGLRGILLPVTFALLGVAFALTYRKPRGGNCADAGATGGSVCCSPGIWGRTNRLLLWVVTLGVLAFAFFPNYLPLLLASRYRIADTAPNTPRVEWVMEIKGMTCQGCAVHVEQELRKVPGVLEATVAFDKGNASIVSKPEVTTTSLQRVVERAGYTVSSITRKSGHQGGAR
ncbi:MAG: hypothetical protein KatS3mg022_0612 [Armatimonadota bacterium]|nr:MAG: hypothetical protein KatS3mg022_0612 [Armatimonadota bacterium]